MKKIGLSLFIALAAAKVFAQTPIVVKDAAKHIGENVIVCDKIFGGKYLDEAQITLLNVGAAFPDSPLTLVIKGDDRKKFSYKPEEQLTNKAVCITGTIIEYHGKPEILITDTLQIKPNDK